MFSAIFDILISGILGLINALVQLVLLPFNLAFNTFLPDLSEHITGTSNGIETLFVGINWALSIIPKPFLAILVLIITIEIGKHFISISVLSFTKLFKMLKEIKFW